MTPTATFWLTEQAVFCGKAIVRRHCGRRYRKHYGAYVDHGDTILPIRASWPKGDEGFVLSLLFVSRITSENVFRNATKHAGHISPRMSNACTPEIEYDPEGPRW